MSQQDVLNFLKKRRKNNKWYGAGEIAKHFKRNKGSINHNLTHLRWSSFIRYKEERRAVGMGGMRLMYVYKWKE